MKKSLLIIILVFIYTKSYSQISYDKGYFINNSNKKTICFIKNENWNYNPTEFLYRLKEEGDIRTAKIEHIKEFGIENTSKYIRRTVNIDKSSIKLDKLSDHREPDFIEEQLYLKVLIEGEANLYQYKDKGLVRFFYKKPETKIEPLIYKLYKVNDNKISENIKFKQQIWTELKCSSIEMKEVNKLDYKKRDLIDYFNLYSESKNVTTTVYKPKKDLFNLTLRPRINYSYLPIAGDELEFGFGIEAEFILPSSQKKWAMIIEPTYVHYTSKVYQPFSNSFTIEDTLILDENEIEIETSYKALEIPIGIRHYIFLNETSKLFWNLSAIFAINFSTEPLGEYHLTEKDYYLIPNTIDYKPRTGNPPALYTSGQLSSTQINYAFGFGYKLYNKYSMEVRFHTNRDLSSENSYLNADYKSLSFILGYSFF